MASKAAPAPKSLPKPDAGAKPKGSLLVWLGATALLTIVALGGGGFAGFTMVGRFKEQFATPPPSAEAKPGETKPADAKPADAKPAAAKPVADMALRDLSPIITNLAGPGEAMIRLQAAILYDAKALPNPSVLAAEITEDIVAYLRTVSVPQIGSNSGLQHLRDDLNDRIAVRSDRKVREIIIQSLVIQ